MFTNLSRHRASPSVQSTTARRAVAVRALAAILVAVAAAGVLAACGGGDDNAAPPALAFDSNDMEPLPAPVGDVVLTIRGGDAPNDGDATRLDLEGMESVGTVTFTLYEPFISADIEATGVPLDVILARAGVDAGDQLRWTALDAFEITGQAGELSLDRAVLLTRVDGEPIPISDGGPIRLAYVDADGPVGSDTNNWIWSIEFIDVE